MDARTFFRLPQLKAISYFVLMGTAFLNTDGWAKVKPPRAVIPPEAKEEINIPIFPTAATLAQELGVKESEIEKYVDDFAAALAQGSRSKIYQKICAKNEDTCQLLSDYFYQNDDFRKLRIRSYRKTHRPLVIKKEQNIAQAQSQEFAHLVHVLRIDSTADFKRVAEWSLKTNDCPRNLSAALSVKAEEFFPNNELRNYSKQLFQHASPCLNKDDTSFERLYLRQGLYAYYEHDLAKAKEFFAKASSASNFSEKYRSLYWLGRIENESGAKPDANKAWNDLIGQFPLSYYAIEASTIMNRDPLVAVTNQRLGSLKRQATGNEILNSQVRWLEALYLYKKHLLVGKWASWIVRSAETIDVDLLHYISAIKISSGLYRSNIQMMFGYFKKHPQDLNMEGLKLLYPRPYFQIVKEASKDRIDPFLVIALMRQESAFDANAVSRVNARGLMQLMPSTARRMTSHFATKKLFDGKYNTDLGVKYLVKLAERFQGKIELVLAAYNAGPNKVDEWMQRNPQRPDPLLWNDLIPFMETRDYVASILRNNFFYARLYGEIEGWKLESKIYSSELVNRVLATKFGK